MNAFRIDPEIATAAIQSQRYQFLGRVGTDISTIGTWDRTLSRRTRILVPIDVQAFVAQVGAPEATVAVAGQPTDPDPFDAGAPKPPGVHLHWAMPDALLVATHEEATRTPTLPRLPDRWVVVRTLQPLGRREVIASGWVIDATTTGVTPLPAFTGDAPSAPEGAEMLDPLDGAAGGLVWTASYTAASGRFAFHDPLDDLEALRAVAVSGFAGDQAVYTVAGWWSALEHDPLAGARGAHSLDRALAALGWRVVHDEDDAALRSPDKRLRRLHDQLGLDSPKEEPATRVLGSDGRPISSKLEGVTFEAGYAVADAATVFYGEALPTYSSLLHGSVLGVPIGGVLPPADDRPAPDAVTVALGADIDDVIAAFGASGLALDDRRAAEQITAAFSSGLASRLGTPDGLDDLAQREHLDGFWSLPGTALPAARADRVRAEDTLAAGPVTVGRKGRAGQGGRRTDGKLGEVADLAWEGRIRFRTAAEGTAQTSKRIEETAGSAVPAARAPESREVARPAPRYYRPQPLLLALRGARPNHRHHGDGLYDDTGRLLCRYPATAVDSLESVVEGATVLPTLGSGAVPGEVVTVVREAVLLNPYGYEWLVDAGAPPSRFVEPMRNRVQAEMVRLYGTEGVYDGRSHVVEPASDDADASGWAAMRVSSLAGDRAVASELARFSVVRGMPPSPVALTTWRQPWVPLWVEWEVTLAGTDSVRGWRLDDPDLEPAEPGEPPARAVARTCAGRSLLGTGVGESLRAAVLAWLASEHQRQATPGRTAYGSGRTLKELAELDAPLDLVSTSLDGVREQLLGIDYVGQIVRDAEGRPVASGAPTVLFGGALRLDALRLVDAFGRVLDVPDASLDALRRTSEMDVAEDSRGVRMRPRIQGSARWLWRLVDPTSPRGTAPEALREAYVDQVEPAAAVNPVAGFLLPDHIDEAVELFTVAGDPIGQVGHDSVSGAVTWEPAPGRRVPPDTGPMVGLPGSGWIVGEIAAGLVRADAAARALDKAPADSALVSLLRAIDTTLWTVDTFAALGSASIAGLVGRPIAVVRASLRLDVPDDLDEVTVSAAGGAAARKAAFAALADETFDVRLGSLARTDDALLGYFVDDDYSRFHLVDKVVAARAKRTGRHLGQLGLLGEAVAPEETTLDHPYLVADGTLRVQCGRTVMLTMLMLPNGRAHLSSGILPRKDLALADSWVTPGLTRVIPSVRVGPLLVDPAEIRLPLISLLGEKQTFTRRTGELTWRDDPILAATQTAYLPRLPYEVQEGWVRVTPAPHDPTAGEGTT